MQSTIVVTGCAGFIGSHLSEKLLANGNQVIGVDNFDPFYDRQVKERNLAAFKNHPNFRFAEIDLADLAALSQELKDDAIDVIVHLAGKAGVRPSIEDPQGYIRANILATQNILDVMKNKGIKKMAFASSSSVYGNTKETPFHEEQDVSRPISPYAFSKKACELINYTYHALYGLDIINMRFFTVFGPRQRPDLAIHKFTKLILSGQEIPMFGDGSTSRDYTYYEDTVSGIQGAINYLNAHQGVYETINLGNNQPVKLTDMIIAIEKATGVKANIKQLPMQAGDVDITFANIEKAKRLMRYNPQYSFEEGVQNFVDWYREVHAI
ncbi:GDP-mannose 4,6-dehydratase [uncultured Sunxiuqinia sp.]|uniref:GDP-mannose 4,6-dehydratase n=1 Tax=uncultured Sunxiuqinia sp. TaxID=1573825 RepID=UPI0019C349DE|nr:GDP-mannose 4,6-dehydratase [Sunxiuqinia sp.]|tara:strand:+ start:9370 stop:10341 length:972 start_codon:yes stop_codon:yes gene_type:complete